MADSIDTPKTYSWVCSTGGGLSPEQRSRIRSAIVAGYRISARGFATWPFHRSSATTEFPVRPDSKFAKEAEEAAAEQGPALEGHSYRTWLIGAALAALDGAAPDPELLYVTSLLHDSGITTAVTGQDFTLRSGQILIDACRKAEVDERRGEEAADAAVSHATPGLQLDDNPVGFCVQCGAMADLAGLRMWDLPKGYLRRAFEAYPAAGVHREVPRLIRREANHVPEGRFALLRRSGLDLLVTASPTRLYARK